MGIVCRRISQGGALSVAKLIEERAPPVLKMIKEFNKLVLNLFIQFLNRIGLQGE